MDKKGIVDHSREDEIFKRTYVEIQNYDKYIFSFQKSVGSSEYKSSFSGDDFYSIFFD